MPDKMNDVAVDAELRGYTNEQASEAEQRAIEFLTKAVRIPGVRVDRDRYLREALDKVKATHDVIDRALASSPAAAGVPLGVLDFLADEAISYETNKSAALSFAAGIPGGFAMLGTIPADSPTCTAGATSSRTSTRGRTRQSACSRYFSASCWGLAAPRSR